MKSSERHFFHYTERTYHCIIMHIFKKNKNKNKQQQKTTNKKKQKQKQKQKGRSLIIVFISTWLKFT